MVDLLILAEEKSMKVLLDGLLPRLFPQLNYLCLAFEGKTDLERNIPRKLRAWTWNHTRFMILRDNDGADCAILKQRLIDLLPAERRTRTKVRLVCQELEAWYFGDSDALADVFENEALRNIGSKAKYRRPDEIAQPSKSLAALEPRFQKVSGARQMAQSMARDRNTSPSFAVTIRAIEGWLP